MSELSFHDEETTLQNLRTRCEEITNADNINKDSALKMINVFHGMEIEMMEQRRISERNGEELRHENVLHKFHAERNQKIESMQTKIEELINKVDELTQTCATLEDALKYHESEMTSIRDSLPRKKR